MTRKLYISYALGKIITIAIWHCQLWNQCRRHSVKATIGQNVSLSQPVSAFLLSAVQLADQRFPGRHAFVESILKLLRSTMEFFNFISTLKLAFWCISYLSCHPISSNSKVNNTLPKRLYSSNIHQILTANMSSLSPSMNKSSICKGQWVDVQEWLREMKMSVNNPEVMDLKPIWVELKVCSRFV